ncbi:unnamed protein product [Moneuplotes crassus]|uniref:GSKIP domain-containing protein n=1 Tax=Euplotes crassus TaxID=5936 RepID=A0AAD1Y1V6_EUPCR|nr:unnamed protein product [Moneuplotes crassus]
MDDCFDWEKEFAEYKNGVAGVCYVNSLEITAQTDTSCSVDLETLEGDVYKINWEITKGGQIVDPEGQEERRYEDINQLLNDISPEYRKAFEKAFLAKFNM